MSSEGKQASRERESHPQDANVAEANKVKHILLKLRTPINIELPTVTNWGGEQCGNKISFIFRPATRILLYESSDTGT